jgi:hypothetical protein
MAPANHISGKRYTGMQIAAVHRPAAWRRILRALELEPEDLLAIPLCLLLGLVFTLFSLGADGLVLTAQSSSAATQNDENAVCAVESIMSVPLAAVRQWFS